MELLQILRKVKDNQRIFEVFSASFLQHYIYNQKYA